MDKTFRPASLDQPLLLPADLREWLPPGDLALYVSDVVDALDLSAIYDSYAGDGRGQPPYDPAMMVKLLIYAYCIGRPSSRAIEQATYRDIAFRVLAINQHPDHDTIAEFRKRHLEALAGLFIQVLRLCQKAGLVKLGQVALDSTKIKANASKHKAMSYDRMVQAEEELKREVADLLRRAQAMDEREDREYGKGRRGDELPEELARRESRLKKIQEAKVALEREAAERQLRANQEKSQKRSRDSGPRTPDAGSGGVPGDNLPKDKGKGTPAPQVQKPRAAQPDPKAQRNFTDPDSRIMLDPTTKGFEQAYNAQIVVDGKAQVIVAAAVTQEANDKQQLVPMLTQAMQNTGSRPKRALADSGYFSEAAVTDRALDGIDLYVTPDKDWHGRKQGRPRSRGQGTVIGRMRRKISSAKGQAIYRWRKAIAEPPFGQIKEVRHFRRFLLRGTPKVTNEWLLITLTHNVLKLYRATAALAPG
jgi:transposase